jgi:glycosyltransferase involved in cell wall biosynthesis
LPETELDLLIGADSLAFRRSGVGRMTLEIVRAARRVTAIRSIQLLMHGRVHPVERADTLGEPDGTEAPPSVLNWKAKIIDLPGMGIARQARQMLITQRINRIAHHGLVYYEPNMIIRPLAIPTVVTINDLSWHHQPSWHPADRLAWIDRHLQKTLSHAQGITALSQFTKDAAVKELGVAAERVTVVPLAPAEAFRPFTEAEAAPVLARFDLMDRAYVLSISTIEPRKNFDRLFAAHQKLPPALRRLAPLVIAGGKGWGAGINASATEAAIRRGELRMLGHVADDDLVALCARAGVFAYVSLYEGFGLPVIEAMAAGCAVVASNTTSIPEVAGNAALLVDPLDEAAIADGLRAVLEDRALADRLAAAGLERAAGFSWDRTVAGLLDCCRAALANSAGDPYQPARRLG